jgi:[ribosomal protein S5]-alanine N-acetyltransferase
MNSPRIRLREHVVGDMAPFCDLQMDPEVGRYVSWLPRPREQCESALLDTIEQQASVERVRYFFAIDLLTTAEMIGSVGYTKDNPASADCGWFLRRPFWGNGYASEAVRQLILLALGDGKLERLTASCRLENRGSIRVAEACGFQRVQQTLERAYLGLYLQHATRFGNVSLIGPDA